MKISFGKESRVLTVSSRRSDEEETVLTDDDLDTENSDPLDIPTTSEFTSVYKLDSATSKEKMEA